MSKPWDKLRVKPQEKPDPIGLGKWGGGDYPQFLLTGIESGHYPFVRMRIGREDGVDLRFSKEGLRLASEFFAELYSQLESK